MPLFKNRQVISLLHCFADRPYLNIRQNDMKIFFTKKFSLSLYRPKGQSFEILEESALYS